MRAGVVSRTATMVIDAAYIAALLAVVYVGYAAVRFLRRPADFSWPQVSFAMFVYVAYAVAVVALTVAWTGIGRSVGMRIMGLRLLGPDGARVHLGRAFLRALACVAFPLGLFWAGVSRRNASIQDLLFGTSVVYDWRTHAPRRPS